ncbi:MAG TPA: hypothetical protein VFW42_12235 [Fluviicoccus sp.]|nr:hypothetical protein [Fluviicoccus sp.]
MLLAEQQDHIRYLEDYPRQRATPEIVDHGLAEATDDLRQMLVAARGQTSMRNKYG